MPWGSSSAGRKKMVSKRGLGCARRRRFRAAEEEKEDEMWDTVEEKKSKTPESKQTVKSPHLPKPSNPFELLAKPKAAPAANRFGLLQPKPKQERHENEGARQQRPEQRDKSASSERISSTGDMLCGPQKKRQRAEAAQGPSDEGEEDEMNGGRARGVGVEAVTKELTRGPHPDHSKLKVGGGDRTQGTQGPVGSLAERQILKSPSPLSAETMRKKKKKKKKKKKPVGHV